MVFTIKKFYEGPLKNERFNVTSNNAKVYSDTRSIFAPIIDHYMSFDLTLIWLKSVDNLEFLSLF